MVYLGIGPAQRQHQCQPRRGAMHECHPLRHDRDRGQRFPQAFDRLRRGVERKSVEGPARARPARDGPLSELHGFERSRLHFRIGLRRCRRGDSQSSGLSLPSPLIEKWNGSSWKIAKLKLVLSGPLTLQDVACLSPTRCAVVGFRNGYIVPSLTAAGIWNGKALVLVKSANEPKYTDSQLFTLGCAGVSRCVALGQAQKGSTYKVIAEKSSLPK